MSEFFSFRLIVLWISIGFGALAGWSISCSDTAYIDGECSQDEDCRKDPNNIPGTDCLDNFCECPPELHYDKCCPFGDWANCTKSGDYACRPWDECHPPNECETVADCKEKPDPRCGSVACEDGLCALTLDLSEERIANQIPGDCSSNYCNSTGKVVLKSDLADYPLDDEPCTVDVCPGATPDPVLVADGTPCTATDHGGVCFQSKCVECIPANGNINCKKPNTPACDNFVCVPWSCVDGVWNGSESDYDCGGTDCSRCGPGQKCKVAVDCRSGVCNGGKCQVATHKDGVQNDGETGVDCGCPACPSKCKDEEGCQNAQDCLSGVCYGGICRTATCSDGTLNGGEEEWDCGGSCELPCH